MLATFKRNQNGSHTYLIPHNRGESSKPLQARIQQHTSLSFAGKNAIYGGGSATGIQRSPKLVCPKAHMGVRLGSNRCIEKRAKFDPEKIGISLAHRVRLSENRLIGPGMDSLTPGHSRSTQAGWMRSASEARAAVL